MSAEEGAERVCEGGENVCMYVCVRGGTGEGVGGGELLMVSLCARTFCVW